MRASVKTNLIIGNYSVVRSRDPSSRRMWHMTTTRQGTVHGSSRPSSAHNMKLKIRDDVRLTVVT